MVGFGVPANIRRGSPVTAPERKGAGPKAHSRERPTGDERIAVLLIDDRTLLGQSLATAINASAPDLFVIHRTTAQAVADLSAAFEMADVVLVSVGRSRLGRGTMARTLKQLLDKHPHPPIAILADLARPGVMDTARRLDLRGILSNAAPLSTVIDALRRIHRGGTVVSDRT